MTKFQEKRFDNAYGSEKKKNVRLMKDMYEGATIKVRTSVGVTE
jgi:hypothetical protein